MNIDQIFEEISNTSLTLLRKYREQLSDIKVSIKEDRTFLTEADTKIQKSIIEIIRGHDSKSNIIAEENIGAHESQKEFDSTWIIDPIDGTKEFINKEAKEYCTAICFLKSGTPIASLIVSPELGDNDNPLIIKAGSEPKKIIVNGKVLAGKTKINMIPQRVSATRSIGTDPRLFENKLLEHNCEIKTRTTSQTIDLVRVAANVLEWPIKDFGCFDIFYRNNQKIWDGAPGILLNKIAGNICINENGDEFIAFSRDFLKENPPIIPLSIVGKPEHVEWFKEINK
jgi:3'(2'), 5'-bisphosphate nucleotidase